MNGLIVNDESDDNIGQECKACIVFSAKNCQIGELLYPDATPTAGLGKQVLQRIGELAARADVRWSCSIIVVMGDADDGRIYTEGCDRRSREWWF